MFPYICIFSLNTEIITFIPGNFLKNQDKQREGSKS